MRPYKDIIHPMLYNYIEDIVSGGYYALDPYQVSNLNDFVIYLNDIDPDGNFAFYPLRQYQNIGIGRNAVGIGKMASGNPIRFNSNPVWGNSGMYFGDSLNNCGTVSFSHLGFAFREHESTVFYVMRHERGEDESTLFRGNTYSGPLDQSNAPYFAFDRTNLPCADWFTITAPQFSTDNRRPRGTTYIYDETFGLDKKGFSIYYSQLPSKVIAQPASFYSLKNNFFTFNICSNFTGYSLRAISGTDNIILSGNFPEPYLYRFEREDDLTGVRVDITGNSYIISGQTSGKYIKRYLMPDRLVLGAGLTNTSEQYNLVGNPHRCAGLLIFSGNYCHRAEEINYKLLSTLNLIPKNPYLQTVPTDLLYSNGNITQIEYVEDPIFVTGSDKFSVTASILKINAVNLGVFTYELTGTTGNLTSPIELFYGYVEITSANYPSGIITTGYDLENLYSSGNVYTGWYYEPIPPFTGTPETGLYTVSGLPYLEFSGNFESGEYNVTGIDLYVWTGIFQFETGISLGVSGVNGSLFSPYYALEDAAISLGVSGVILQTGL